MMFMISHSKILKNYDDYVVLQQLAPEAILSVQLLIPQLYNYRIIVQLSEVTLIDFCIAPIIAVRLVQEIARVHRLGMGRPG